MRGNHTTLREELDAIWTAIQADELLAKLQSYRWTGRPGHSLSALWRAYVASYFLHLPHTNALIRRLQDDGGLREACGFGDELPSRWTFNRFFSRLSLHPDLIQETFGSLTDRLAERLPDFGKTIAVDSTTVRSHSSPNKGTDPEAGWTAKTYNKGKSKKSEWFWGYKLHLAVDAQTELPISAHVTTGNRNDSPELLPLLHQARDRYDWFAPDWVLADKGYDAASNFKGIADLGAIPIIDVRQLGKGKRGRERESRPCEAYAVITPDGIQHRCNRQPWDPKCPRFGQCPLFPVYVNNLLNTPDLSPVYERYTPFPYGSKEWKAKYTERSSVERVNSRLKECRRLEGHCFRGLAKVAAHALMSVLVLQASALSKAQAGDLTALRGLVRRIA